jgi:class 3 adenylate cyclase
MRCPQCGHENAVEMKFCGECGTRLAAPCRRCGARNAPAQKFCGECGARLETAASSPQLPSPDAYTPKHLAEKILTSKTALEGERKHVTVLFADLKGSMELLADRDPEDARKLLDPVLVQMMEAVHHCEAKTRTSPVILLNSRDKPWTSDGFRTSWGRACAAAGIVGLTFHDLRGTAVTRLAVAGCTEAEIATITGHSLRDVHAILDANYLHRDPALAERAIRKPETRTKTPDCAPDRAKRSHGEQE